jgi:hypothetical protein
LAPLRRRAGHRGMKRRRKEKRGRPCWRAGP